MNLGPTAHRSATRCRRTNSILSFFFPLKTAKKVLPQRSYTRPSPDSFKARTKELGKLFKYTCSARPAKAEADRRSNEFSHGGCERSTLPLTDSEQTAPEFKLPHCRETRFVNKSCARLSVLCRSVKQQRKERARCPIRAGMKCVFKIQK